jgi:hypothetical protein
MSDWSNDQKTARLGRVLNASWIIREQVSQLGGRTIITAIMLDINTMKVSNPSRMQLNLIDEIFDKMPAFVIEMTKVFPRTDLPRNLIAGGFYSKSYLEMVSVNIPHT